MTAVTIPLQWSQIADEASEIVRDAAGRGLSVRLLGSAGIRLHCQASAGRMDQLGRSTKDVDVVIRKQDRGGVRAMLEERGYKMDRDVLIAMEGQRYLYRNPGTGLELDVFVDRLEFCHTLDVRQRMDKHALTLPLEDLTLSKAQIVEMTPNDVKDLVTLLSTHEVSDGATPDAEALNAPYIAGVLAQDWGFGHTVVRNLAKVAATLDDLDVGSGDRAIIADRIRALIAAIDRVEKSLKWRMRAKLGERKQWWQDVDEREATY